MSQIAATIIALAIVGFFLLDWNQKPRSSGALWIPVVWIFIVASRPVSMWLNMAPEPSTDQVLDGSPIDRNAFALLLALGFIVLLKRGPQVRRILLANRPIVLYFVYCGISIIWSDYPVVALKRWTKFVGDLIMILIVITDRNPSAAFRRFLAWPAFVLIPLSVLFIKYYPALGRCYDRYSYQPIFVGITYNKNLLGMVCLIWGAGLLWFVLEALRGALARVAN